MDDEVCQADVAERAYRAVEEAARAACPGLRCEYEYLPADAGELPCLSMITLAGSPVEMGFLDGSYIANYRFALQLRQAEADTRGRLDAAGTLRGLADALRSWPLDLGEGKALYSCSVDTLPSRVAAAEGAIDYQVTLTVRYKSQRDG